MLIGLGDDVAFERRLVETITWCSARLKATDHPEQPSSEIERPMSSLLRSEELYRIFRGHDELTPGPESVRAVASRRAELLAGTFPTQVSDVIRLGRLLIFLPWDSLSDGAANLASNGFFDDANVPPCDTWVALFHDRAPGVGRYLVSWVPHSFTDLAGKGIDVNPEACITWLSETSTQVAARLRTIGLLA